jgi:hypothetical protein
MLSARIDEVCTNHLTKDYKIATALRMQNCVFVVTLLNGSVTHILTEVRKPKSAEIGSRTHLHIMFSKSYVNT